MLFQPPTSRRKMWVTRISKEIVSPASVACTALVPTTEARSVLTRHFGSLRVTWPPEPSCTNCSHATGSSRFGGSRKIALSSPRAFAKPRMRESGFERRSIRARGRRQVCLQRGAYCMWYPGIDWADDHHGALVIYEKRREVRSVRVT